MVAAAGGAHEYGVIVVVFLARLCVIVEVCVPIRRVVDCDHDVQMVAVDSGTEAMKRGTGEVMLVD